MDNYQFLCNQNSFEMILHLKKSYYNLLLINFQRFSKKTVFLNPFVINSLNNEDNKKINERSFSEW